MFALGLLLLLLAVPAFGAESRAIAVDVPAGAEDVAESLHQSGWVRWIQSQNEGLTVVVEPGAKGDTEILVRTLPVDEAIAGRRVVVQDRIDGG